MTQLNFKELVNKEIVAVDNSCINRVLLTTTNIVGNYTYYWLYTNVTSYGISYPVLNELTVEEFEELATQGNINVTERYL